MLRLIGIIVIILLIIGPLLVQLGLLDHAGLIREFVDLETRTFVAIIDGLRSLVDRLRGHNAGTPG